MTRRRILVSAYGCEPNKGSEPGVGWEWCKQLARSSELVVLTRTNNQRAISEAISTGFSGRVKFEYVDLPFWVKRIKKKEKGLYAYYFFWQCCAYFRAKKLISESKFNYVMHITFGSIWMPTFMHRLPLPFIWGPIGGGEAVPYHLIGELPAIARLSQYLRYGLMATISWNPFLSSIFKRSTLILARTQDTAKLVPKRYSDKVRVVLETAMADELLVNNDCSLMPRTVSAIQVVYTGRLVGFKNLKTALYAVAETLKQGVNIQFLIIGSGPMRTSLEALVCQLEISKNVSFLGNLPQTEMIAILRQSDIYFFPSLREGGVWSLMEAMAVGLPCICVKSSGVALITDDYSAIRIEPTSTNQMIKDFSNALTMLSRSSIDRSYYGSQAKKRIKEKFLWGHKGLYMDEIFKDLEGDRN